MSKELEKEFTMVIRRQRPKENFVLPDPINSLICVGWLGEVYKNPCIRNLEDIINQG